MIASRSSIREILGVFGEGPVLGVLDGVLVGIGRVVGRVFRVITKWALRFLLACLTLGVIHVVLDLTTPYATYADEVWDIWWRYDDPVERARRIDVWNRWVRRFFDGPPSDDEMIAFLDAHRADLERLVILAYIEGEHHMNSKEKRAPTSEELGEKAALEKNLGVRAHMGGTRYLMTNKFYGYPYHYMGVSVDPYDSFYFLWARSNRFLIKRIVYVPDIADSSEEFKGARRGRVDSLFSYCSVVENTDGKIAEVSPYNDYKFGNCVVREIDAHWYIVFSGHIFSGLGIRWISAE